MESSFKGFRKIMLIVSLLSLNIVEQAARIVQQGPPQIGKEVDVLLTQVDR